MYLVYFVVDHVPVFKAKAERLRPETQRRASDPPRIRCPRCGQTKSQRDLCQRWNPLDFPGLGALEPAQKLRRVDDGNVLKFPQREQMLFVAAHDEVGFRRQRAF